jgi:hypothetical protein
VNPGAGARQLLAAGALTANHRRDNIWARNDGEENAVNRADSATQVNTEHIIAGAQPTVTEESNNHPLLQARHRLEMEARASGIRLQNKQDKIKDTATRRAMNGL